MAADGNLLKGEVNEDPKTEERHVEQLLQGLLGALLSEQIRDDNQESAQ